MKNQDIKNKPQHNDRSKTDRKNKQELAAAYLAHQPNAQQSTSLYPQANRYIRSWVEGTPDSTK